MQFKSFIKSLLPDEVLNRDSYKNTENKGLLERYLNNFGEELDQNLEPYLTNFLDLLDPRICDPKYLTPLSFILGLPPSIDKNISTYRKILSYAIQIYKLKGTKKSYQLLFNLIGISIEIVEEIPRKAARYDDNILYDETTNYDDECDACSYYSILYYDPAHPLDPVPQDILDLFSSIICFLQPINAKLRGYIRSLYIEDSFIFNVGEDFLGINMAEDGAFGDGFDNEFSFD